MKMLLLAVALALLIFCPAVIFWIFIAILVLLMVDLFTRYYCAHCPKCNANMTTEKEDNQVRQRCQKCSYVQGKIIL